MKSSPLEAWIRIGPDETLDPFAGGRIQVIQKKRGYRFSIDALLLAQFITFREPARILDLGTGCGILPLLLSLRFPRSHFFALEISPELTDVARRNILINEGRDRIFLLRGDIRRLPAFVRPGHFDVVVSNPPYRPLATGRINPDPQKALARHELAITLEELIQAAVHALKARGRWFVIYPAWRLVSLLALCRRYRLEPKKLQLVHSFPNKEAEWVLLEAVSGGKEELHLLPPFFLYSDGEQSDPRLLNEFLRRGETRNRS